MADSDDSTPLRTIFVSYAREDAGWVDALGLNRKPTSTEDAEFWVDEKRIKVGVRWTDEAELALTSATAAVLLVSRDFLDSRAIATHETPRIVRRWKSGEIAMILVPIGDLDVAEVGKRLKLSNVQNIVSIPAWDAALPAVPTPRPEVRTGIVSAATEEIDVQSLRRTLNPNYYLKRRLGSGPMGRVFTAQDVQLNREVAIKLLHAGHRGDDFARSVKKIAAAADHTYALSIYEAYLDAYPPHFVRQFADGESLRSLLDRRRESLPLQLVQRCLAQTGRAVCYAHDRGVSGLVLKPSNIIVTNLAEADLQTFMLTLNSYPEDELLDIDMWRTNQKDVFYLPIEYRSSHRDSCSAQRADQYRLGLIAYEMIIGAQTFAELAVPLRQREFQAQRWKWPSVSEFSPDCPEHLATAVDRMVSTEPGDRFDSIKDAIENAETHLDVEVVRESYRHLMKTEEAQISFFRSFYARYFTEYPQVRSRFFENLGSLEDEPVSEQWQAQFQSLKEAVLLLIVYYTLREDQHEFNILTRIADGHARRGIHSFLYDDFGKVLVDTIVDEDKSSDAPKLRRAWEKVVEPGISYMKRRTDAIEREEYRKPAAK